MNTHFEALEFHRILAQLQDCALSEQAREELAQLSPCLNENICRRKMAETTAARAILDTCGAPPLATMTGLADILTEAAAGAMLLPEQLVRVVQFAAACKRMVSYLRRGEACGADIAVYGRGIADLSGLQQEIGAAVSEDGVYDEASPALRDIRRRAERLETQIKEKLAHILQSRKQYLADSYISRRNGHYVLPVQRRYQSQFGGTVIEASGKGTTVFMEPSSVAALQAERDAVGVEEDCEVRRILYALTARVEDESASIRSAMEVMEILDVLFAKAKYSAALHARPVTVGGERRICIRGGRHPLLKADNAVPLNFETSEGASGVIITGPNTGGKTVALKTVGLLSLMAQCGLHIPCEERSYIAMQDGFFCDIGDSQNISQNLSTFSGHMTNVIDILEQASRDSLVLLDELGSGTDPAEGMGIAIAVLEELRHRGGMFLVTTHYPQVKSYAEHTEGIVSARMAFDPESLRPLYCLEMGKSGESCALYIAARLGLAPHLLARARQEVYGTAPEAGLPVAMKAPKSRLERVQAQKNTADPADKFHMGDSVLVLPEKETGIVYRPADENGDVIVQVKGKKRRVKHTRIKLQVAAEELYPPDYDFSIIFDTVENRKAQHIMSKRYDADAAAVWDPDEIV